MHRLKISDMLRDFDFERVKAASKALSFEFIVTELDLAITFALTAKSATASETAARNLQHAGTAYNAATRFLRSTTLEPAMAEYVSTRMARLHVLIEELGRRHSQSREEGL